MHNCLMIIDEVSAIFRYCIFYIYEHQLNCDSFFMMQL